MFDSYLTKKENWGFDLIGNLCDVQGGLQITPKRNSNPIAIPYLRVANVFRGFFDLNEIKIIRATAGEVERISLKKGDVLIVEGHGNINEIGRAALWNGEIARILHQNHLIRVRVKSEKLNSVFLNEYLNSYSGTYQMKSIVNTTSGLNTISTGKIKSLKIPVPPIDVQNKFAEFYKWIQNERIKLNNSKNQLTTLFESLIQKSFNGQLNFNIDLELEALINEIDTQKNNNDLSNIERDNVYLQRLIDKLNNQEFTEKGLYDKAKHGIFQLMAAPEKRVTQEYDEETQSLKLVRK